MADFGIARAYQTPDEAETESPTSFTRTYAAPEVVQQEKRGFSADIFSLGCVFIEMIAALLASKQRMPGLQNEWQRLQSLRISEYGDTSYQANIDAVCEWYKQKIQGVYRWDFIFERQDNTYIIPRMIHKMPSERPRAQVVVDKTATMFQRICTRCFEGPEPFEAAKPWSR